MVYETGLLVGGVGIVSACIAKVKCYVKKKWGMIIWLWISG